MPHKEEKFSADELKAIYEHFLPLMLPAVGHARPVAAEPTTPTTERSDGPASKDSPRPADTPQDN